MDRIKAKYLVEFTSIEDMSKTEFLKYLGKKLVNLEAQFNEKLKVRCHISEVEEVTEGVITGRVFVSKLKE